MAAAGAGAGAGAGVGAGAGAGVYPIQYNGNEIHIHNINDYIVTMVNNSLILKPNPNTIRNDVTDEVTHSLPVQFSIDGQILQFIRLSFKEMVLKFIRYIRRNRGTSINQILEHTGLTYRNGNHAGYQYERDLNVSIAGFDSMTALRTIKNLSEQYHIRTKVRILRNNGNFINYQFN